MHCTHKPQNTGSSPGPGCPAVEPSLLLFWDACLTDLMGGCRLVGLSKRAKKHSIAADCGELKATFGPRLRGTAKHKVKH